MYKSDYCISILAIGALLVFSIISSINGLESGSAGDITVMKKVSLDEVTPQGRLHYPSSYHVHAASSYSCHYWITYLDNIPEEKASHHRHFGIAVAPRNVYLRDQDAIHIMAFKPNDNTTIVHNETWKSSYQYQYNREFIYTDVNVCINMTGRWNMSRADILLTLYFDNSDENIEDFCPDGMALCRCPEKESIEAGHENRCISKDLFCNGVANCGCDYDEDNEVQMCSYPIYDPGDSKGGCVWTNIEYLLMMVLTGFLLILIPVVFLLTLMYHRRMRWRRRNGNAATYDNNNNNEEHPHVTPVPVVYVDPPPNYDDLPDELKMPPRTRRATEEEVQPEV